MTKRMNHKHRRKQRAEEAGVRQSEYDSLSVGEKIKRAESRRGESRKELRRLRSDQ